MKTEQTDRERHTTHPSERSVKKQLALLSILYYIVLCNGFIDGKFNKKVQVGNDQEKAQSERIYHSKNRGGKK